MPAVTTYSLTGNSYIDGVLGDVKWATNSFTFSFPTDASHYGSSYGYGETTNNFGALSATQQTAMRASLTMFASVANVSFTEIAETSTQSADLRFAMSDKPSTAWAYFPTTAAEGGDAWFNKSKGYYDSPAKGNYAHTTFIHEIGHALGLEHAHEKYVMPTDRDSMEYTVMSYRSYVGASTTSGYTNETWGYAQSLMMYDIAALQHMYGANYATNGGNTTYSWSPTTGEMFINGVGQGAPGANRVFQTVWDGGGTDVYDFSNYATNLTVDLRPGHWTTTSPTQLAKLHFDGSKIAAGNIANALLHDGDVRSLIEHARGGSGHDVIYGNSASNSLFGNRGNDALFGLEGDDALHGGPGSDTLDGGVGWDEAIFDFRLTQSTSDYGSRSLLIRTSGEQDGLRAIEQLRFSDGTVIQSDGFSQIDDTFYFTRNHDVWGAHIDPEKHYDVWGWKEGRNPNQFFDTSGYLAVYTDVAAAGMNPLHHYTQYGWKEGRDPSSIFDTAGYLSLNPDVAAAGVNPLEHYLQFGVYEGRAYENDGMFG
jgi:serralysin